MSSKFSCDNEYHHLKPMRCRTKKPKRFGDSQEFGMDTCQEIGEIAKGVSRRLHDAFDMMDYNRPDE